MPTSTEGTRETFTRWHGQLLKGTRRGARMNDSRHSPPKRSRAPEPITPLRARPLVFPPSPPTPTPKWGKWRHMRDIELWEGVALSLNLDPEGLPVYLRAVEHGDDPFKICPAAFKERLEIAVSSVGTAFPVKERHLSSRARSLVDLPVFCSWIRFIGWELPANFMEPSPKQTPSAAPHSEDDRRLEAEGAQSEQTRTLTSGDRIVHSTKATRRNDLTPVIEKAQALCTNRFDAQAVWNQLQAMAERRESPLLGNDEGGIKYLKGGIPDWFTRKHLRDRLRTQKRRANAR